MSAAIHPGKIQHGGERQLASVLPFERHVARASAAVPAVESDGRARITALPRGADSFYSSHAQGPEQGLGRRRSSVTDPLLSPARVAPDVAEGDAALHRFLACVNGGESDLLLGDLLERHARPIVTAVVRRKLGGERGTADAEDIAADVLARLVSRLLEIRSTPGTDPIASFAS